VLPRIGRLGGRIPLVCLLLALGWQFPLLGSELWVTVIDPAGGPLPKAWVNVTGLLSGKAGKDAPPEVYHATTDRDGRACITVREGAYAVEVGLLGFMNVRYLPVRVIYPDPVHLEFELPIGDILEGRWANDVLVSGTLRLEGEPLGGVYICLFPENGGDSDPVACGYTNRLGEYALSVPKGRYRVTVRTFNHKEYETHLDGSSTGWCWNELSIDKPAGKGKPTEGTKQ
jgi:hypothetical protein